MRNDRRQPNRPGLRGPRRRRSDPVAGEVPPFGPLFLRMRRMLQRLPEVQEVHRDRRMNDIGGAGYAPVPPKPLPCADFYNPIYKDFIME